MTPRESRSSRDESFHLPTALRIPMGSVSGPGVAAKDLIVTGVPDPLGSLVGRPNRSDGLDFLRWIGARSMRGRQSRAVTDSDFNPSPSLIVPEMASVFHSLGEFLCRLRTVSKGDHAQFMRQSNAEKTATGSLAGQCRRVLGPRAAANVYAIGWLLHRIASIHIAGQNTMWLQQISNTQ